MACQCVTKAVAFLDDRIQLDSGSGILPSITSAIDRADPEEKAHLVRYFAVKEEQSETASISSVDTSMVRFG